MVVKNWLVRGLGAGGYGLIGAKEHPVGEVPNRTGQAMYVSKREREIEREKKRERDRKKVGKMEARVREKES